MVCELYPRLRGKDAPNAEFCSGPIPSPGEDAGNGDILVQRRPEKAIEVGLSLVPLGGGCSPLPGKPRGTPNVRPSQSAGQSTQP